MKLKRVHARGDTGAAMVEMAIILPVLLLLVIGIVNLGYLASQAVAVNSAARQGGRAAVVKDSAGTSASDKAKTAVNTSVASGTLKNPGTTVKTTTGGTTCGTGSSVGKDMKVTVTYTNPGWLVPVPFFSVPVKNLTAESWYRCEW